ncbi:MAG TPA: hypothetical protein VNB90_11220 [Cytophagaceae bacterium]|jgi:hypothetical protein|nr:hypothetical protein [Cytophagaceae bacterium]
MEIVKPDLIKLKALAPKAWADFENFYQENFPSYAADQKMKTDQLPFELLLGLLLRYFIENGVEWDVSNTDYTMLPDTLLEVFENYEKVISHYS